MIFLKYFLVYGAICIPITICQYALTIFFGLTPFILGTVIELVLFFYLFQKALKKSVKQIVEK